MGGTLQGAGEIVVSTGKELGYRAADFSNDVLYLESDGLLGSSNLNLSRVSQLQASGQTTAFRATFASVPIIGNGYNLISGTDLLTGAKLNGIDRTAAGIGLLSDAAFAAAIGIKLADADAHLINCFVAGTDVLLGDRQSEEDIEDVHVGQRVATDGGVANSADGNTAATDPNATQVDPQCMQLLS